MTLINKQMLRINVKDLINNKVFYFAIIISIGFGIILSRTFKIYYSKNNNILINYIDIANIEAMLSNYFIIINILTASIFIKIINNYLFGWRAVYFLTSGINRRKYFYYSYINLFLVTLLLPLIFYIVFYVYQSIILSQIPFNLLQIILIVLLNHFTYTALCLLFIYVTQNELLSVFSVIIFILFVPIVISVINVFNEQTIKIFSVFFYNNQKLQKIIFRENINYDLLTYTIVIIIFIIIFQLLLKNYEKRDLQ